MLIPFLKEPFLRLTHLTAFVAGLYANFQLKSLSDCIKVLAVIMY